MPTLPKWLANGLEKTFASMMHPVSVEAIEDIDQNLRRVVFSGDLSNCRYTPGNVIEFRVSERDFRHYTPSVFDPSAGLCEVIFYLHGSAPGTQWLKSLREGQTFKLMGPGGHLAYRPDFQHHLIFGDESALGLTKALQQAIHAAGQTSEILLELESEHHDWPERVGLKAQVVGKSASQPAQDSLLWLERAFADDIGPERKLQQTMFYLTGRAQSIQKMLKLLKQKGIGRQQIVSEPYWADHKQGL